MSRPHTDFFKEHPAQSFKQKPNVKNLFFNKCLPVPDFFLSKAYKTHFWHLHQVSFIPLSRFWIMCDACFFFSFSTCCHFCFCFVCSPSIEETSLGYVRFACYFYLSLLAFHFSSECISAARSVILMWSCQMLQVVYS